MAESSTITKDFCEFIEELIILRKLCQLQFRSDNGATVTIEARLTDLYADEGVEFLETDSKFRVSLSQVIDIDGRQAQATC